MHRTEQRNPLSTHMDTMDSESLSRLIITANYEAVKATEDAAKDIARAVDAIAEAFDAGHRLVYVGAGTSGRLGVLDATECPPTFGVSPEQVTGIIAGGREMMFKASENMEDKPDNGAASIVEAGVQAGDVVVGISAAGNAAFVAAAMEQAKELGCTTVGIACNPDTLVLKAADIAILTDTGPEVLTGSTRLKAGTAQKIVLNTLTTAAMAKTGKVYENMMINLRPTNQKLKNRVIGIVREITGLAEADAVQYLEDHQWNIRNAAEAYKRDSEFQNR